jgi:NAD-dependent SIR2 family protein deacetylase
MAVTLRCPSCREKFPWDTAKGWPRFCAMCGTDISAKDDDAVVMPNILSFRSKVPDQAVRQYMDGSEKRVEMAAELAGTTRDDMSSLKVTDISDRADVQAHIPVNNPVTQFMAANPGVGGMSSQGAEYSTQVQNGPFPNVGAKMMTKIRDRHGTISNGSAISDRPALETQQPGYRRRG